MGRRSRRSPALLEGVRVFSTFMKRRSLFSNPPLPRSCIRRCLALLVPCCSESHVSGAQQMALKPGAAQDPDHQGADANPTEDEQGGNLKGRGWTRKKGDI